LTIAQSLFDHTDPYDVCNIAYSPEVSVGHIQVQRNSGRAIEDIDGVLSFESWERPGMHGLVDVDT
jgi:hypothetical protein